MVYISWHYTTMGISFLKNVLSYFYTLQKLPDTIYALEIEQEELNKVFNTPTENRVIFDEIFYFVVSQSVLDDLSRSRVRNRKNILEDELVKAHGLEDIFSEIINNQALNNNIDGVFNYVQKKYPERFELFKELLWRDIHYFPVQEQIKWLLKYSNFTKVYTPQKFHVVELNINDLRDEKQIAKEVSNWCKKHFTKEERQAIINISLNSTETQVVWHILAESNILPENARLVKTYDSNHNINKKRFKLFNIKESPRNLISSITQEFKIYPKTQSPSRRLVNKKLEVFLQSHFSILLIGERGIGKSQIASNVKKELKNLNKAIEGNLVEANCASFDDDSKAEAELFGYKKGAFTGANQDKKGLFEEADRGILFLDEVHHLSKLVQAKLMKAIQTDQNNKMAIRPLGSNKEVKVECRLIFATNKKVEELKQILLPDFYDRIVQHVVEIPSLRETIEDREQDWENIWKQLKFGNDVPKEEALMHWLKTLALYGNYRDLQKIAMYYRIYQEFDQETRNMIPQKTPFEYAKSEFEKYHSFNQNNTRFNFDIQKTTEQMIAEYKYQLQEWAVKRFGGRKKAVEHFNKLGDTITEKTLNNWKNKDSLREKKSEQENKN